MKVNITGPISHSDASRVLAIEAATKSICDATGSDKAEAVMMHLLAAAHIALRNRKPGCSTRQVALMLAQSLGKAMVLAQTLFALKSVK